MIDQATLDGLWDFSDPTASEQRLREAAENSADHAELRTQVARALGLQGRFADAHLVLDTTDAATAVVRTRIALERGRLHNSAGDPITAVPFFETAAITAQSAHLDFLEVDALHMLAITDTTRAEDWTGAGIAVVERTSDRHTKRWATSLYNNLGWRYHESGDLHRALGTFELALASATTGEQRFYARFAVARCLRSLGRSDEARVIQKELAAEDPDDHYVLEELDALGSE